MEKPNSALMSRRVWLAVCAIAIRPASRAFAAQSSSRLQTASSDAISPANTGLVKVFATVRDKKGKIVQNLAQADFTIREEGRKEAIRSFAQQSNLPLTLGLLVDTSRSEGGMLETERAASDNFFFQELRPGRDRGFLIHYDREVELLQDLTSSAKQLHKALDELSTPRRESRPTDESGDGSNGGGNRGTWGRRGGEQRRFGGAMLYDAVYLASNDLMKKQTGRKAIVVLGDGVDRGSKVSLTEAIDSARRAGTLVYSVRIHSEGRRQEGGGFPGGRGRPGSWGGGPWGQGPWGGGGMGGHRGGYPREQEGPDGKKILQQIAKETGGGYFEPSKKETLGDIYVRIQEELQNQYLLAFEPDTSGESGFHKIQVSVKRKGCTVQAPEGYFINSLKS